MRKNTQYKIELLINYYEGVISFNEVFPDLDSRDENNRYKHLVSQLIVIRQAFIDKNTVNINGLYIPIRESFINGEHFSILEDIVGFYKNNPDAIYNVAEAETYLRDHLAKSTPVDFTGMKQITNHIDQCITGRVNTTLAEFSNDFNTHLTNISKQLGKFTHDDLSEAVAKFSNDILASLSTSRELMKSDIAKYDALLTEHINKSGINIAEAIEKEHARFVQKIASDSNAIIAGISKVNAAELATQTELIKQNLQGFEDKSFKQFSISFVLVACALFACAILSSTWTANKIIDGVRTLKIATAGSSNVPVISQKPKHH